MLSSNVQESLDRLNSLLPLAESQRRLDAPLRNLHRKLLQGFAGQGRPLSREEMATLTGDIPLDTALERLAADDLVVLSADRTGVTGAYPFTVGERVHTVQVNGRRLYAMCALDALSVAPMFDIATTVNSRCHVTDTPIGIRMQGREIGSAEPAQPRVGIRWQSTSGCAAESLCLDMVFLRDRDTAEDWRAQDPDNITILDLPSAVAMGAAFFCPLLDEAG
jgi:mercuric reductase